MLYAGTEELTFDQPELATIAREESNAWVERLCAQLTEQGREICGGWPGTVSEARRLVAARLATEGRASASFAITEPDTDRLVKAVYLWAKREWLSRAPRRPMV